jgi:hypothetical protein
MLLGKAPDNLIWLLLTVLAVWRLTALIAYESGPFGMFTGLRRLLVKTGLGNLAACFYCLSVWMSLLALLVFPLSPATPLVVLGVAGAVAIIERALSGDRSTGGTQDDT